MLLLLFGLSLMNIFHSSSGAQNELRSTAMQATENREAHAQLTILNEPGFRAEEAIQFALESQLELQKLHNEIQKTKEIFNERQWMNHEINKLSEKIETLNAKIEEIQNSSNLHPETHFAEAIRNALQNSFLENHHLRARCERLWYFSTGACAALISFLDPFIWKIVEDQQMKKDILQILVNKTDGREY